MECPATFEFRYFHLLLLLAFCELSNSFLNWPTIFPKYPDHWFISYFLTFFYNVPVPSPSSLCFSQCPFSTLCMHSVKFLFIFSLIYAFHNILVHLSFVLCFLQVSVYCLFILCIPQCPSLFSIKSKHSVTFWTIIATYSMFFTISYRLIIIYLV